MNINKIFSGENIALLLSRVMCWMPLQTNTKIILYGYTIRVIYDRYNKPVCITHWNRKVYETRKIAEDALRHINRTKRDNKWEFIIVPIYVTEHDKKIYMVSGT